MICAYEPCQNKFQPKTHNQKYCSDECCRIATNLKIKEKYYEEKERKRGVKRVCGNKDCNKSLSRYNEYKICSECQNKSISLQRKKILEMVKNVSS